MSDQFEDRRVVNRTLLEVLGSGLNELEGNELEAALFEALDDLSDKSTLDTVGLHGRKGRLRRAEWRGEERLTLIIM